MRDDQRRILDLLAGRRVLDKRGLPQTTYLKEGSAKEVEARRALARELRTSRPLDIGLKFLLADLIDPDNDVEIRHIRFGHRRKGKKTNADAEKTVAEFLWERVPRDGAESAFAAAKDKFRLGRSRIAEIWGMWKPILKRLKRQ